MALTNATLPYAVQIANKGWRQVARENAGIKAGINIVAGKITYQGVAEAVGMDYVPVDQILGSD
jgi:alanine dehydrogenase